MEIEQDLFLTFDVDWAPDKVIQYCLKILEKYEVSATFFATHNTPILENLEEEENFEIGIHPNFNPLLDGNDDNQVPGKSALDIIHELQQIVSGAVSVRSHSLVEGSIFCELFQEEGLKYDCNPFIPYGSMELHPWKFRNGIIKVPCFWSDYMHLSYSWNWSSEQLLTQDGLKVFAFHPIHVFLNTFSREFYDDNKDKIYNSDPGDNLRQYQNTRKQGIKNILVDLIRSAKEQDFTFRKICEIQGS